ncbi:MAG: sel1 repeat family protein [Deltaproteobacteria bacterium]|nr:sel1 repeat family protein [Deltaproteobacteria bacterium]
MKYCSQVALLALWIIFACCGWAIAYETNSSLQYKLKIETENLFTGNLNPETKVNMSEEELFYAAMKSDADAQFKAGLLFGRGEDVRRNFSKCIALLKKAASAGHVEASFLLGTIYLKGGNIFQEVKTEVQYGGIIIPEEFPYDKTIAFYYYLISGNRGDRLSYDICALLKKQSLDIDTDTDTAIKMLKNLEELSSRKNALAMRFLAELYSDGKIVKQDDNKASDLFKESAEHGDIWGEYSIARRYIAGLGVDRDTVKGFFWMKKAAENNLAAAQFDLAVLYYLGTGIDINRQMGYAWLLVAKANGHKEAESLVNESDNGGLTPEEEKQAHEIAEQLLARMPAQKDSIKLIAALGNS